MPPSPARRSSPGRELRGDNHKRGRSLEPRILLREREDDLALFNEMQTRERESFLLKSNDDFEDTFSTRLRSFSDHKIGISIPARGESRDLLNGDLEKNDYDWLLTPPDTPLFPSLDDEASPTTLIQRGRPRNQPIAISRSSTMEKGRNSNRGSASPNRLSPSPRSGDSPSRRPSTHSNPTPSLRPASPSRRPTPSLRPASPSTAPTRRMSTGSCAVSSSRARGTSPLPTNRGASPLPTNRGTSPVPTSRGTSPLPTNRGTSPVPTSRGNSASPKISAWQTNIPGFSSEAPPNLRTSLADRPASYVRGSSPAPRNGRDLSSRSSGRQSMSPTPSRSSGRQSMSPTPRSGSSSHSHDRDIMSSHGKVSVASSGDDDVESLQSVSLSSSSGLPSRRVGAFPSNRAPASSKKPNKVILSSSAPKRSFDSALRQMDHRKSPQNMFRPLLSSVPSSSFYVGKASAAHRAMISRNSSVTTSSNASSDQGISGVHDTEGSDHNLDNMIPEWGQTPYLEGQDDLFSFEKVDALTEDISHVTHNQSPDVQHDEFSGGARIESQLGGSEDLNSPLTPWAITAPSKESELLEVKANFPEVHYVEVMPLCYKCGRMYHDVELTEGDSKLCSDCRSSDKPLTTPTPEPNTIVSDSSLSLSTRIPDGDKSFDNVKPGIVIPESLEVTDMAEPSVTHKENFLEQPGPDLASEKSIGQTLEEEDMSRQENLEGIGQPSVEYNSTDSDTGSQQMQRLSNHPNSQIDISEGHGISVLLTKSSSVKGPILRGRTFSAASIPFEDPSYVREYAKSMRSSHGHGSVSASSSVDWGLDRQIETRVQRQLSSRKSETVTNPKHQRTGSSLSATSSHAFQGLGLGKSMLEEKMEVDVAHVKNEVGKVNHAAIQGQLVVSLSGGADDACTEVEGDNFCGTTAASKLSAHALNTHSRKSSVASVANVENFGSYGKGEEFPNQLKSISDQEASALTPESSAVEEDRAQIKRSVDEKPNSVVDKGDVSDVPTQNLQDMVSDIEIDNDCLDSFGSQSDVVSTDSENTMDELLDPWHVKVVGTLSESHGILEESAETVEVTVEGQSGTMTRRLSVDEAEDTHLFCSAIIENLACEAATLAMEKENTVSMEEDSRPMVTILGNSNSELNDRRGRSNGKQTSKSQKVRQKRAETKTKLSADENENSEQVDVSTTRIVGAPPTKGDTMKPLKIESKCNCTVM